MPKEIEDISETEIDEEKIYVVGANFCGYTKKMLDVIADEKEVVREKFLYVECDGADAEHSLCTQPVGQGYPHLVIYKKNKPTLCHVGFSPDVNSLLKKCTE